MRCYLPCGPTSVPYTVGSWANKKKGFRRWIRFGGLLLLCALRIRHLAYKNFAKIRHLADVLSLAVR